MEAKETKYLLNNTEMLKKNPALVREAVEHASATQKAVLEDILSYAHDTDFGKKYDFSSIRDVDEYRKRVPVSEFADYSDYIERLKKAEENVLFPGKAVSFICTSGTTGNIKYIPESEKGDAIKQLVNSLRIYEMAKYVPELVSSDVKMFTISNIYAALYTEGGIPVGTASGQAAARAKKSASRMVVPNILLETVLDPDRIDYMTALYGISDKNVGIVICNNLAHLKNLITVINDRFEMIVGDIRNGTISYDLSEEEKNILLPTRKADPERADELLKIFAEKGRIDITDIWKNVRMYGCWLSSGVGRIAKELRPFLHKDAVFMHWGYGASEGKFDIPTEPDTPYGLPVVFGYFFEFLKPGSDKTVLIEETSPDVCYELVLTSYSGFYRYNIHDFVKVFKKEDGLYRIEFICKSSDCLTFDDKKFYAYELTDMIEEYESKNGVFFRLFQGMKTDDGMKLLVEPAGKIDKDDFEAYMTKMLFLKNITLSGIEIMHDGYRDECLVQKLESGKSVNQTKLQIFIK